MAKIVKAVSFDSEKHEALLRQVNALAPGTFSQVVRDALTAHFEISNGVTLTTVYQAVQDVKRQLSNGVAANGAQGVQADDDGGDELGDDILGSF